MSTATRIHMPLRSSGQSLARILIDGGWILEPRGST
jgi:hypothetical protein